MSRTIYSYICSMKHPSKAFLLGSCTTFWNLSHHRSKSQMCTASMKITRTSQGTFNYLFPHSQGHLAGIHSPSLGILSERERKIEREREREREREKVRDSIETARSCCQCERSFQAVHRSICFKNSSPTKIGENFYPNFISSIVGETRFAKKNQGRSECKVPQNYRIPKIWSQSITLLFAPKWFARAHLGVETPATLRKRKEAKRARCTCACTRTGILEREREREREREKRENLFMENTPLLQFPGLRNSEIATKEIGSN